MVSPLRSRKRRLEGVLLDRPHRPTKLVVGRHNDAGVWQRRRPPWHQEWRHERPEQGGGGLAASSTATDRQAPRAAPRSLRCGWRRHQHGALSPQKGAATAKGGRGGGGTPPAPLPVPGGDASPAAAAEPDDAEGAAVADGNAAAAGTCRRWPSAPPPPPALMASSPACWQPSVTQTRHGRSTACTSVACSGGGGRQRQGRRLAAGAAASGGGGVQWWGVVASGGGRCLRHLLDEAGTTCDPCIEFN